ncbi:MAG: PilZ domain-containing protein [Spirochaetales bacterium]|nr:MAG: PilZ domain-containing protein [Spirochaetales bacterium]
MKILLVSERDELKSYIHKNFMPRGAEIIQYYNPIKAMDNLDEVEPDVILFSAQDFPRHWKPFLAFLRDSRAREQCVFVILTGTDFDHEEADKAQALHVNGIVHEQLRDRQELARLKELVNRYRDIGDPRTEKRLVPTTIDRVGFIFTHPQRLEMIFGRVEDLSAAGASFVPTDRHKTMDIAPGTTIRSCCLRIGDRMLSFSAEVVRNERSLSFLFDGMSDGERSLVRTYVNEHAQRELDRIASDVPTPVEPL